MPLYLFASILQRKSAVTKEPKPCIETEAKEEQQKEILASSDDNAKTTSETADKQVLQPTPPEDETECYFSADRVIEYQWPPDRTGEFYLLRHQVCQFLEIETLEEKYPG